jgi:phosphoserine phosphatase RsbU/P
LKSYKDTTRQDWGLVIAGFVALGLFFWLTSDTHPLSSADSSLGEERASQKALAILQENGFTSEHDPFTRFRINERLADSVQVQQSFKEFYGVSENRRLFPVYVWDSNFYIEPIPDRSFDFGGTQAKTIRILLNEQGEWIGLSNTHELLPRIMLNTAALTYAFGVEPILPAEPDSVLTERLTFDFNNTTSMSEPGRPDLSARVSLDKEKAEKLARYYLQQSAWPEQSLSAQNFDKVIYEGVEAARVTFSRNSDYPADAITATPQVSVTVLASGALLSLTHRYYEGTTGGITADSIKSNIRGGIILLSVFLVIILLFARFRMRLIDMKAAVLVAVLAGFILPFIIITQMSFSHIRSFGELDFTFFVVVLLSAGVTAAFTSILYFLVTSISDSVTRQEWSEKLRTMDLIRTGHFVNRPVGLAFIRGIMYSFIICGLISLMMAFMPGSFYSLEQDFFGSGRYLPGIVLVFSNLIWFFIVAQAIYLIVFGYLRMYTKSPVIFVLGSGFIFALMNPFTLSIGPLQTELIVMGAAGIVMGLIYYREDFLTTFITLFFTGGLLLSVSGWLFSPSPDSGMFFMQATLIAAAFIYGGYSVIKGKPIHELPEFVPEYIRELAQEERIKQELQIARKVQESFLPERTPDFPGLDIAAVCKPAYETGGDYYDFIELKNNRLAVTIGDVSGKGIQAAFYMTFIKGVLHAICEEFRTTTEVLCKSNTLFRRNARKGTFVSLIFGVIDSENNNFTFSRAGHNPLLYFNRKEEKLYEFTPEGIGLGMAGESLFGSNMREQSIRLNSGDLLIMFTDGIVEAANRSDAFYGDERLHGLIRSFNRLGADDLLKKVMEDLEMFSEGASQHDDMTMLVIKKR